MVIITTVLGMTRYSCHALEHSRELEKELQHYCELSSAASIAAAEKRPTTDQVLTTPIMTKRLFLAMLMSVYLMMYASK